MLMKSCNNNKYRRGDEGRRGERKGLRREEERRKVPNKIVRETEINGAGVFELLDLLGRQGDVGEGLQAALQMLYLSCSNDREDIGHL